MSEKKLDAVADSLKGLEKRLRELHAVDAWLREKALACNTSFEQPAPLGDVGRLSQVGSNGCETCYAGSTPPRRWQWRNGSSSWWRASGCQTEWAGSLMFAHRLEPQAALLLSNKLQGLGGIAGIVLLHRPLFPIF